MNKVDILFVAGGGQSNPTLRFFSIAALVLDPQGAKLLEDEVKIAEDKFQESKVLAETAMANFLASDVSCADCRRGVN